MAINVKFGATDAGFTSTVKKINESVDGMEKNVKQASTVANASFGSMVKAGAALAVGMGAVKAATSLIAGTFSTFKEALDFGGEISDVSARTGVAADQLVVLRRAFENAGLSAGSAQTSINRMQKAIVEAGNGSESKAKAFRDLGINLDEIRQKSPTEQLKMLGDRIAEIEDPAARSAAAMAIFGKSGAQMLTLFRAGGEEIENARAQLGSFPAIMEKLNVSFDTISDNITAIKNKALEFAAGVLSKLAPALELATTLLSQIDAAAIGMRLGEIITGGTTAMDGFNAALEAVKLGQFKLGFTIAFESIKLQAAMSLNSIYKNIVASMSAAWAFIKEAFGPGSSLWILITESVSMVMNKAGLALSSAIYTMVKDLWFVSDETKLAMAQNMNAIQMSVENSSRRIQNTIGDIPSDFVRAAQTANDEFEKTIFSAKDLVSTTEMEISLQKSKIGLMKLQSEEAQKRISIEEVGDSLKIKLGNQHVTNSEKIKQLETDITSAKAQGNNELAAQLTAQKLYYEQLERSMKSGKSLQDSMVDASKAYSNELNKAADNAKKVTKEVKEQLGLFGELKKKIAEAREKDKIDPGGRLEARINDALGKGRFEVAEKLSRKLGRREADVEIQKAFGGGDKFNRSIQDLAREQGIDTFRKSSQDLRKELQELARKRQDELKPGAGGKRAEDMKPKQAKKDPIETLSDIVKDIRGLVQLIEPKLPTTALGL